MGKISKQKPKMLNASSEHKPSSSRFVETNRWRTKPVPAIVPSQRENGPFQQPEQPSNGIADVVTFDCLPFTWKDDHLMSISASVKNKLAATKKKKKRLAKRPQGLKPLTTVESDGSEKFRSVNRFLYFEHAQVTEEDDDEGWSIDDLLEASRGCNGAEINEGFKCDRIEIDEGIAAGLKSEVGDAALLSVSAALKRKGDEGLVSDAKRPKLPPPSYYVKPVENGVNVCLRKDATIYLHGLFEMQVLFGSVEVLGKKLDVNSKPFKIYSSRGTAFLSITNLNTSVRTQWLQINEKLGAKNGARKLSAEDAILYCRPFDAKLVSFLEDNLSQVLFPKPQDDVRCVFRDCPGDDWSVLRKNEQWEGILERAGKDSRVMLCGGKGVGKSTLLRFVINRLLQRHEAVSVVDLDAGQAEFTVAGCISTLVIKEALLGPNYTHLRKPERCIFIPNTDITADYETYLECVRELMRCPKLPAGVPTVVNYVGFTKGLGPSLAAAAIAAVRPTLVVQIESPSAFKNYAQDLTPENVRANNNLLPEEETTGSLGFELLKVDSVATGGNVWELQPRQMREMSILAYFSKVLPADCSYITEAGVKLYRTSLNDIKILHNGKECDPSAVNANIVGLCTKTSRSIYECRGWGIVRSISMDDDGDVTLITPLEEPELEEVDHLIMGSVSLPPSVYFRNHADLTGHVPYVYEGDMLNFAKSPKRFIVPKKVAPF